MQYIPFWLASAALFLLPGALAARRFPLLWHRISPGERLLPSFLLSAAVYGLVYLGALALRPTLSFALLAWVVLTAALASWNLIDRFPRNGPRSALLSQARLQPPGDARAWLWTVPLLVLGWVAMLIQGGSLGFVHDSLDFAAYVNRMLLTGRCDLASGAFADTAGLAPDPRRGTFHLAAALLCRLSGVSAVEMWRAFPSFLVPLALWVFFASMRRVLQSAAVAWAALAFFVAVTFFTADHFINNLAYASRLGWVYSWVGLWALALFLDRDREDGTPPPDWRPHAPPHGRDGRAAWILSLACAPILLGIHILSAAQYLVALGAFAWTWSLSRAEPRPVRRRLALTPLLALAALIPFLLLKLGQSYSAANPLFDHPQGLLYLGGDWAILSPTHLAGWYGWPGLWGMILALPLLTRFRRGRGLAFLTGCTVAPILIVLNPVAMRLVEEAKAHSLLFRVLFVTPYFQVLGWWTVWSVRQLSEAARDPFRSAKGTEAASSVAARIGRGASRRRILPALFLLAVTGMVLVWHFRGAAGFWSTPEDERAAWGEMPALRSALRFLDAEVPASSVVASDPITSYFLPAYTRHYAVTPLNQHSSPADERTVERIQDAHGILSPYTSAEETVRLLRKYDVSYVLLNQSFPWYQNVYYAYIAEGAFPLQRAKFLGRPDLFTPVYDRADVRIFRFHEAGLEGHGMGAASHEDAVNPFLVLGPEEGAALSRAEAAARFGMQPFPGPAVGGLELVAVAPDSTAYHRGSVLLIRALWRRENRPMVLPVSAFVRVQTGYPDRLFHSPWIGKPYRFWYESRRGVNYRWGRDREPLAWIFPAYLWTPGALYQDEMALSLPQSLQRGPYDIRIHLHEVPFTPNIQLRDLFRLDDSLNGVVVGTVRVE